VEEGLVLDFSHAWVMQVSNEHEAPILAEVHAGGAPPIELTVLLPRTYLRAAFALVRPVLGAAGRNVVLEGRIFTLSRGEL